MDKNNIAEIAYGYQTGIGGDFTLRNGTLFFTEIFYKRYVADLTPDHPLDRRLHGVGLRAGIKMTF